MTGGIYTKFLKGHYVRNFAGWFGLLTDVTDVFNRLGFSGSLNPTTL